MTMLRQISITLLLLVFTVLKVFPHIKREIIARGTVGPAPYTSAEVSKQ